LLQECGELTEHVVTVRLVAEEIQLLELIDHEEWLGAVPAFVASNLVNRPCEIPKSASAESTGNDGIERGGVSISKPRQDSRLNERSLATTTRPDDDKEVSLQELRNSALYLLLAAKEMRRVLLLERRKTGIGMTFVHGECAFQRS
jgi:hypothetical protein